MDQEVLYWGVLASLLCLLVLIMPLLITYAMARHRFWGLGTVLQQILSVAALLVLLAIPIALAAYLISWRFPRREPSTTALLIFAVVWLGYWYIRAIGPFLDRHLYRRVHDFRQAVMFFGGEVTALGGLADIQKQVLSTVRDILYPERVGLVLLQGETVRACWMAPDRDGAPPALPELCPTDLFLRKLALQGKAVTRAELERDKGFQEVRESGRRLFQAAGAEIVVPMSHRDALVGLLILGEKRNGKPYFRDELDFLEKLSGPAALGLSNALLFNRAERQREELALLNASLEQRVEERTGEIEQMNLRLREANAHLSELDRLKSHFFANISHELRTPLTLILVPAELMLEEESLPSGMREQLEGIRKSALELLKRIDDLLDLSRLEESKMKLDLAPLDLSTLARRVLDTTRPMAAQKGIELVLEAARPAVVQADEGKIERVLVNLLSNAIKFTASKGRVTVRVQRDETRGLFSVEDTGIGIPADQHQAIFNRFTQVDSAATRRYSGSGIGLALARELVELHRGQIRVVSAPGQGSAFTVELPATSTAMAEQKPEPAAGQAADALDAGFQGRLEYRLLDIQRATERRLIPGTGQRCVKVAKVLVADDNEDMLRFVHRVLCDRYEVWTVQDGKRALELLLAHHHDLLITDIMMPEMNGFELCYRIKSNPATQETPVLLLTARKEEEDRIKGHGIGADQYLAKPFHPKELRAVVDGLLSAKLRNAEIVARKKQSSLESLLAGLAHELRNACQQLQGSQKAMWTVARRLGLDGHPDKAHLVEMDRIADRATKRVAQVVDVLQQLVVQRFASSWSAIDLDELIQQQASLLHQTAASGVSLELSLRSGARIHGPKEEVRQMILNLTENALQAVSSGGRVQVESESLDGKVRLCVRDNGCGIPPELQDRIFDPFFSTKAPGQNLGMGLSLCKRTIEDLNGTITVRSQPGVGTEISVELPILSGAQPGSDPPALPGSSGLIGPRSDLR